MLERSQRTHQLHADLGDIAVRFLDWLNVVVWGVAVLVGMLQSQRINAGWLTNYGGDVFGTAAVWWVLRRTIFAGLHRGAEVAAAATLIPCSVWEFCQLFDRSGTPLSITRGSFDRLDLVAYGATVAVCYVAEKCLRHHHRSATTYGDPGLNAPP